MKKKIVIFGATGSIGAYIVDYFSDFLKKDNKEYEIVAVGRKKTTWFYDNNIDYRIVDITKAGDFDILPQNDVWAIINMAGVLPAYLRDESPFPYIDVNINGGVRVLEYAKKVKADRVLYTQTWASMAGYWGKHDVLSPNMERKLCYTDDHTFYTISKSCVVEAMKYYKAQFGIKDFVFRLPNIYCYTPQKTYFANGIEKNIAYRYMIDCAIQGDNLELWGNPNAFKDIVYVKDLAQMLYKACFANVDGGTYNVGTGIKTTLREQLEGIVKVFTPENSNVKIIEKPEKPSFVSFVMDIENAKSDLGYAPCYDYISYLKDYKKEMEENRFNGLWSNN